MRQPPKTVLFPTMMPIVVQDNGDGTWTAMLHKPIGDGHPYTEPTMELAVKTAVTARYKPFPGEVIVSG